MKIETLVNLIKGELLNTPFISEVVFFTGSVEEVNRGACFFSNSIKDIVLAIKKGAYAIVSEENIDIIDEEIAWIKVDNFKKALLDIFKYENLTKVIYFTDDITAMIIEAMKLDKNVVVVKNDNDIFEALNSTSKYVVVSSTDIKNMLINIVELEAVDIELDMITLFKSKFKGIELNLPYVYKTYFSKAFNFFQKNSIEYNLDFVLDRFKPMFVNINLEKVPYGQSDKVIILGIKNDKYFFEELNYIIENTKHAKTIFINNTNYDLIKGSYNFAVLVDTELKIEQINTKNLFKGYL